MKNLSFILSSLLFCFLSIYTYGQLTTDTLAASKDSYISSENVSTNFGATTAMSVGRFNNRTCCSYHTRRGVVEFDMSSIPSNAIIVSAKLRLNQASSSGSPVIYAGRLTGSWGETSITWANQPNHTDVITSSSVVSGWLEIDVKSHVQKMVAGVYDNFGWMLRNNDETASSNVSRTLRTKEYSSTSLRPKLEIQYYLPITVSAAAIVHASSDSTEDGSVSPTLDDGPGGLIYKWYNSADSLISTSMNLVDVPFGWYGLEVSSSNVSDTYYHAFAVGVDCDVVDIEFKTSPKYTSNARISTLGLTTNYGNVNTYAATEHNIFSNWYKTESLLKFNLWIDSTCKINTADLTLYGSSHSSSSRNNEASLRLITDYWDETTVTWSNSPAYSDTMTIYLDSTTTTEQDRILDMVDIWEYWKNNNSANKGIAIQLDNYIQVLGGQTYHSPNATSSAEYPKVDFTLDLRRPPVVMAWDTVTEAGEIFIDLNNVCGKISPYKYLIAQDTIPELSDIYAFIKDTLFGGEYDSTSFFEGTTDLTKLYDSLSSGTYYVAVFDSTWTRVVDEKIHVQAEFSFSSQTGLIAIKDTITATQNGAIGSLKMYVNEGLTAHLSSRFLDLGGSQYIGFSLIDSTVSSHEDIMYGFYIEDDTVYTVQAGTPSISYTLIDSTTQLTLHVADTILYLSIGRDTVLTKVLASGFAYKTDIGLQNGKSLILKSNKLVYKKPIVRFIGNVIQHLICDGTISGSFQFKVSVLNYFGVPYSVDYSVVDENANPVVTGGTALTGTYETVTEYEGTLNPLLPGRYKITGTVNCSPNQVFEGYITLGYEANWNHIIDYDQIPNAYSLKRTASSASSYLNGSYAKSNNFLSSSQQGWVEFIKTENHKKGELFRFSVQNLTSLTPDIMNEDLIVFTKILGSNFLIWNINGNTGWIQESISNDKMRIAFNTGNIKIFINGIEVVNENSLNDPRVLRFQTLPYQNGFEDVITSFTCSEIDTYAKVERKLRGVKYRPYINKLHFYMEEEYEKMTSELVYRVLSSTDAVNPVLDGVIQPEALPNSFGDNRYKLDVSSLTDGSYILEVQNEKQEKFYLRFIK